RPVRQIRIRQRHRAGQAAGEITEARAEHHGDRGELGDSSADSLRSSTYLVEKAHDVGVSRIAGLQNCRIAESKGSKERAFPTFLPAILQSCDSAKSRLTVGTLQSSPS